MKNVKMFKKLLVVVLSLVMILAYSNIAFAAEEEGLFEGFTDATQEPAAQSENNSNGTTNTSNTADTNNTANTSGTSGISNTSTPTSNTNSNSNSNSSINVNTNTNNANVLADTGLSDAGAIIALIVVLCAISAIYSYKKVSDYKKL